MLNKCFKYACAHEKTAFLAKTDAFLYVFLVFLLLGVAPQGGSSSFLLLVGTICSFVNECALTLWQRTRSEQFLCVKYCHFLLLGWTFGAFEIHGVGLNGYWNFICQNVLCFLAQKVAIINYVYFVNTCLLACYHSISCYSFFSANPLKYLAKRLNCVLQYAISFIRFADN